MMNLSIYDDDGTLGLDNARQVVLRGTVTVSQLFSPNFLDVAGWIKIALQNAGFYVVNVRMSAAGWIGYTNNIEIELEVYNNFTSDQARVNAIAAIEAYTANFGLNKPFYNTTLSVAYDAYVAPGSSQSSTTASPKPKGGNSNGVQPYQSPYDQTASNATNNVGDFFSNFGKGLGLSSPYALLAGGVLLLILLKK